MSTVGAMTVFHLLITVTDSAIYCLDLFLKVLHLEPFQVAEWLLLESACHILVML